MEIILNNSNFEQEAEKSEKPVLVDFWATWCGPCKMLSPVIEEIAKEYDGKIKVGKVNVDDEPDLAAKFGIEVIPTLILFKDGKIVGRISGYYGKDELVSMFGLDKE